MENHQVIIKLTNASVYCGGEGRNSGPENTLVLSDVNVSVSKGELVYLIGRVGSGKSSFLKTLYAELPLKSGNGTVAGFELRRIKRKKIPYLRRRLGIVFQDYKLLGDRNVYDNLRFVLKATNWKDNRKISEQIDEVLEMVSLTHKVHKMPFEMSGGEQQRLAIARALLNNPEVILADEPTGNLDPAAADVIMNIFLNVIRTTGCSVLMATHNISNLQNYPSRTLRFNQGHVEDIDVASIFGQQ